jgi:hypothetical protein
MPAPGIQPLEQHHEQEFVEGMNIGLNRQERAFLINETELATVKRKPRALAGCGCFISRIGEVERPEQNQEENVKAIAGICPFCREEALQLLKKGEILAEQVDLSSCYCTSCKKICDICNRHACRRHILKFENADGSTLHLCPECQVAAGRQKLVKGILQTAMSLFTDQKPQPQLPTERAQNETQTPHSI